MTSTHSVVYLLSMLLVGTFFFPMTFSLRKPILVRMILGIKVYMMAYNWFDMHIFFPAVLQCQDNKLRVGQIGSLGK